MSCTGMNGEKSEGTHAWLKNSEAFLATTRTNQREKKKRRVGKKERLRVCGKTQQQHGPIAASNKRNKGVLSCYIVLLCLHENPSWVECQTLPTQPQPFTSPSEIWICLLKSQEKAVTVLIEEQRLLLQGFESERKNLLSFPLLWIIQQSPLFFVLHRPRLKRNQRWSLNHPENDLPRPSYCVLGLLTISQVSFE